MAEESNSLYQFNLLRKSWYKSEGGLIVGVSRQGRGRSVAGMSPVSLESVEQ